MFKFKRVIFPLLVPAMLLFMVACDEKIDGKKGTFWLNDNKQLLWSDKGACESNQAGCQPIEFVTAGGKIANLTNEPNAVVATAAELKSLSVALNMPGLNAHSIPDVKLVGPEGLMYSVVCTDKVGANCTNLQVIAKGVDFEKFGPAVIDRRIQLRPVLDVLKECRCCPNGECCPEWRAIGASCRILARQLALFELVPRTGR